MRARVRYSFVKSLYLFVRYPQSFITVMRRSHSRVKPKPFTKKRHTMGGGSAIKKGRFRMINYRAYPAPVNRINRPQVLARIVGSGHPLLQGLSVGGAPAPLPVK
jgi:hypothetical protein